MIWEESQWAGQFRYAMPVGTTRQCSKRHHGPAEGPCPYAGCASTLRDVRGALSKAALAAFLLLEVPGAQRPPLKAGIPSLLYTVTPALSSLRFHLKQPHCSMCMRRPSY